MKKTRYALCGLSVRGIYHFLLPLLGLASGPDANDFSTDAEVVGILDIDEERVRTFNAHYGLELPFFHAKEGVDRFIAETCPDVLLVAGPDFTHKEAIVAGLRRGLRVVAEKPVVSSCAEMREVLAAENGSRGSLVVAHNGRYNRQLGAVRECIASGEIGRVTNIEYIYNLDTFHGSSYFYRWNRQRAFSGGLSVHKGVHHFDLLHWLVGSPPETIFGFGALNYFGVKGAHKPEVEPGAPLSAVRAACPYFQKHYRDRLSPEDRPSTGWDSLRLPQKGQYPEDAYIYDEAIDIEDTYSAVLQFRNGASAVYSCNFSTPNEGYTLAINGTHGRIEAARGVNPDPTNPAYRADGVDVVRVLPLFGPPREIVVPRQGGGHGGSDVIIQRDLFADLDERSARLGLQADSYSAALAVACGEGLWRSVVEKRPFSIRELLGEWYRDALG